MNNSIANGPYLRHIFDAVDQLGTQTFKNDSKMHVDGTIIDSLARGFLLELSSFSNRDFFIPAGWTLCQGIDKERETEEPVSSEIRQNLWLDKNKIVQINERDIPVCVEGNTINPAYLQAIKTSALILMNFFVEHWNTTPPSFTLQLDPKSRWNPNSVLQDIASFHQIKNIIFNSHFYPATNTRIFYAYGTPESLPLFHDIVKLEGSYTLPTIKELS